MAKYYKEKAKKKKHTFVPKLIEGVIISLVMGIIIFALRSLINSIPAAMAVVGGAAFVVSFFLRPSVKAVWHAFICAGCTGLLLVNLLPFVANLHLFEGYKAARAKRWDIAIKNYQKALQYDPLNGEINFYTGFAYMKSKKYDKAAYHFKKSLETKLDPSAFNNLGNVYLEQGKFAKAEEVYKDAFYTRVSRMYSLNNLGAIYQKTGRLDESLQMFKRALDASPDYKVARKNLQVVKNLKKKYAYIEKRYGKDFLRYFFTSQSYLKEGRKDKAKDFFLRAANILIKKDKDVSPGHPGWRKLRAHLGSVSRIYSVVGSNLVKLGRLREAIAVYQLTLRFRPKNIKQLYKYVASLYMKIGEKEKAQKMLKKAKSLQ